MFTQLVDGIFWDIALWVFAIGVLWRILSIFRVRGKPDLSEPRGSALAGAIGANLSRFLPRPEIGYRTRLHVITRIVMGPSSASEGADEGVANATKEEPSERRSARARLSCNAAPSTSAS